MLDFFLRGSELGERGYRSIVELLVDFGLHLGFCLDLEALESLARIFTVKDMFLHCIVLCLPDQPLILAEHFLRQLEHLKLRVRLYQQLLVEVES